MWNFRYLFYSSGYTTQFIAQAVLALVIESSFSRFLGPFGRHPSLQGLGFCFCWEHFLTYWHDKVFQARLVYFDCKVKPFRYLNGKHGVFSFFHFLLYSSITIYSPLYLPLPPGVFSRSIPPPWCSKLTSTKGYD